MAEQTGDLIAERYRLERCLARGGMGSVWVAEHLELASKVAVKLLRPDHRPDDERIERFRREAQEAGRLKSPHIVRIQDFGLDRGVPFIVMELLLGEDLGRLLDREGCLTPARALRFLDHAARGLAVAHEAGIVHRDIKPANLFVERHGTDEILKIVDFGVAKRKTSDATLTTGGVVWGSPAFMSPEQARGRTVDERTDVWALAGVFFRMLTGVAPFSGSSEHDVIVKLCTEAPPSPLELNPLLPRELEAFFRRALARDPEQRTGNVSQLVLEAARALSLPLEQASAHEQRASLEPLSSEGRDTETLPITPDQGAQLARGIAEAERLSSPLLTGVVGQVGDSDEEDDQLSRATPPPPDESVRMEAVTRKSSLQIQRGHANVFIAVFIGLLVATGAIWGLRPARSTHSADGTNQSITAGRNSEPASSPAMPPGPQNGRRLQGEGGVPFLPEPIPLEVAHADSHAAHLPVAPSTPSSVAGSPAATLEIARPKKATGSPPEAKATKAASGGGASTQVLPPQPTAKNRIPPETPTDPIFGLPVGSGAVE